MSVFLRVDINIVAMILLGLVFFIANRSLDKKDSLNRFFLRVSQIIIIQLLLETSTCVINKRPELWLIPISVLFHIILFITAPVLTYHCFILIKSMINLEKFRLGKREILLLIPLAINIVITLLSPKYKFIFFIDSSNVYQRGQLFFVSAAITYFYFIYGLILLISNRRKIVKHEFVPLLIFTIMPIIGGLFQTLFYGVLLMWSSAAFSLIILYFYLQQRIVQLDDLTGAWNRNSFEYYITKSLKQKSSINIGIIYADIDDLKQINDMYGHIEGDFAIKTAIEIIESSIRKNDIVVRMGGDEFIVVLECWSNEALENTIKRIEASLLLYNENSGKGYKIECSFGADIFNSNHSSIEQFLHHIDTLMYRNKKVKKSSRRNDE